MKNEMTKKTIENREARLLNKEKYLRKARNVSFKSGIAWFIVNILFVVSGHADKFSFSSLFIGLLVCLGIAYEAHLKIRHIESIKYHSSNKQTTGSEDS